MSTINFNSDVTAKIASGLTEQADSHAYLIKTEHTDSLPSTIQLRRRLAKGAGSVRRTYITRTRNIVVDAGTELERVVPIVAKMEFSIPVGVAEADVTEVRDDLIGIVSSAEVTELNKYGILPSA